MKKSKFLCIALAILLTFGTLSQMVNALYPTTDPWPMYRHDLARTGSGTSTTVPSTNATVWLSTTTTGGSVDAEGSPVIVGGMVIYPYYENLYALDEATGVLLWKSYTLDGTIVNGCPTVSGDIAYVATSAGSIWEINVTDGTLILGPISVAPGVPTTIAVAGSTMYFGTNNNYIYAYDTNGTFLWYYGGSALAPIYSSPAVQGNLLYFGCNNGNVYCLNVSSPLGAVLKWTFRTGVASNTIQTTPCVADGKVFVGSEADGSLYVLNATSGEFLWKWTTTVSGTYALSSPAYSSLYNLVFVTGGYNHVYALYADATPGFNYTENNPAAKYWSTAITNAYFSSSYSPAVAAGEVFVTSDNVVYALSVTGAGKLSWFYGFGGGDAYDAAVADGRVFCTDSSYGAVCLGSYFPALTYYYPITVLGHNFVIELVIANATPSQIGTSLYGSSKEIDYNLTGITDSNGWSNITIPNQMLSGPYIVTLDGGLTSPTTVNNGTYSSIYFAYTQSSHSVVIKGTAIVPEFPSYIVLPLLVTLSLIAVVFAKKKLPKN